MVIGKLIIHVKNQHWGQYTITAVRNGLVILDGKRGVGVISEKELNSNWQIKE